jgi:uncharacterized protein YggT (Ycf19 family)
VFAGIGLGWAIICPGTAQTDANMTLIDFILNVVGVLLWLNWRSARFDPLIRTSPASLVATLRRAEPKRKKSWPFLVALGALLLARASIYSQIGTAADWVPKLDLDQLVLPFRTDSFLSILLYSVLSFIRTLLLLYVWVMALVLINRTVIDPDPILKLLRLHLGRVARIPWPMQVLLPITLITGLWIVLHPALLHLGLASRTLSNLHLLEQGLLISLGAYLSLKYLFPVVLLAYFVVSYVYLGTNPAWDFICSTSRNLLLPIRGLPLRLGKLDLAPLAGVIVALLVLHILPNFVVRRLNEAHLTVWPL